MIPVFTRLRITSAYELLEQRLGIHGRLVAACMFILVRLAWMGLLVYLAAKAVVEMLGWDPSTVPYAVAVAGAIAVVYTALSGLRAVMITDVIQFRLLVSGALLTILLISVQMGGVGSWWPTVWAPNWDVQPFFSLDLHVARHHHRNGAGDAPMVAVYRRFRSSGDPALSDHTKLQAGASGVSHRTLCGWSCHGASVHRRIRSTGFLQLPS